MSGNAMGKFWRRLFGEFHVGDRVRLVTKNTIFEHWVKVEKRKGVVTKVARTKSHGVFFEVHFVKKDNPLMNAEEDYCTFREDELELI